MESKCVFFILSVLGLVGLLAAGIEAKDAYDEDFASDLRWKIFRRGPNTVDEVHENLMKLKEYEISTRGHASKDVETLLEYPNLDKSKCTDEKFLEMKNFIIRAHNYGLGLDEGVRPYVTKYTNELFSLCQEDFKAKLEKSVESMPKSQVDDLNLLYTAFGGSECGHKIMVTPPSLDWKYLAERIAEFLELRDPEAFEASLKKKINTKLVKSHVDQFYRITEDIYQQTRQGSDVYIHVSNVPGIFNQYSDFELEWAAKFVTSNAGGGKIEFAKEGEIEELYDALIEVYKARVGGSKKWYKKILCGRH